MGSQTHFIQNITATQPSFFFLQVAGPLSPSTPRTAVKALTLLSHDFVSHQSPSWISSFFSFHWFSLLLFSFCLHYHHLLLLNKKMGRKFGSKESSQDTYRIMAEGAELEIFTHAHTWLEQASYHGVRALPHICQTALYT